MEVLFGVGDCVVAGVGIGVDAMVEGVLKISNLPPMAWLLVTILAPLLTLADDNCNDAE